MLEEVVLVDELDQAIGSADKQQAHQEGSLHRAFSLFVFNDSGQLLLQQRAAGKYHSATLWSNTCCGHPRPNEPLAEAIHRRLREEMGFDCELNKAFDFIYKTPFENGLMEHEFDHVFVGRFNGTPKPNSDEASGYEWLDLHALSVDISQRPERYTFWFKHILEPLQQYLANNPLSKPKP